MLKKRLGSVSNFIFDLDGTIINSSSEVLHCLKIACDKVGATIIDGKLTSDIIGPPLLDIIKSLIAESRDEAVVLAVEAEYSAIYDNDVNDTSFLFPEVFEWLISLKSAGKRLFMATNKPKAPTLRLIKQFNLDMLEDVYTIDKYDNRKMRKGEMIAEIISKNSLEKADTLMIGDAPSDVSAAHFAGIEAVGVLWGYGDDKEPLKSISDYILDEAELKDIVSDNGEQNG